jgi:hypothetical protein
MHWRATHPATCKFWKELFRAIRFAIRTGQPSRANPSPIIAGFADGNLTLTLPSGRSITYPEARLVPGKYEDGDPDVQFRDNARGQWKLSRGWFGTFVENVVQGVARDLLAAAINRCEARGIHVVFHCHDEVTVEVPIGTLSDEEFLAILRETPPWADGLPLNGKVHSGPHYLEAPKVPAAPLATPESEAKAAVGPWNFKEISPGNLFEPFNPFVQAVVLRMNEAHDLGDSERVNRYALYERLKIYAAAPPDVLRCNDKHLRHYYVPNVLGLIVTTNHKTDGLYLPSDDRRYYVAWSHRTKEEFTEEYFNRMWTWLLCEGGNEHVAAYLAQRDLSTFNSHAPPRQTAAFFDIVHAGRCPEDAELADVLDELKRPEICTLPMLAASKIGASLEWLLDHRHRRSIPHRMERCGYVTCRNPNAADGLWFINGRRQTLYGKASLAPEQRIHAARLYATTTGCY